VRGLIGILASQIIVLQLLLAGIVATQMAVRASADAFVICHGNGQSSPSQPGETNSPNYHAACAICAFAAHAAPVPADSSHVTILDVLTTVIASVTPPHYIRTELLYKHPNGFYAGPNVEWMPQAFFADNANSLTVDPYALLNFRIGYDPGIGWSGYLEGRNLFDKRYISTTITAGTATPTSALFNPGTGVAIYGGMRYRM
jgi:outer membrane receptor protein involved in Fe transport